MRFSSSPHNPQSPRHPQWSIPFILCSLWFCFLFLSLLSVTLALAQRNPHMPHPARAPDSPLSDVMELRDLLAPSKPVVAMFPVGVGVGCGATVDGLGSAGENGGLFGLPESAGVFQIGTK